jgi:hypothetical protein
MVLVNSQQFFFRATVNELCVIFKIVCLAMHIGDYVLLDTIGQGNSCIVFKARHVRTGQLVAIKQIQN